MRLPLAVLILAALPAAAEPLPADAGAINVHDYGARGDGAHDDTQALLKAIAASGADTGRTFWQDRPVYLPDGTYLVSDTLLKRYADGRFASGLFLIGQSRAHTVIRLADHAPGFGDAGRPKAVVFTTSKQIDGTPTSGGKDYPGLGEGNDAYMNFVEDLTIDAGRGNPGAIGIDYLANNLGAIRNVTLTAPAGSGAVGLSMTRKWPGPALIETLSIQGFDTGIAAAQTEYGVTFDNVRLAGQHHVAIRNDNNALAFRALDIQGPVPAIVNGGAKGFIVLDGGTLEAGISADAGLVVGRDLKAPAGDWKPTAAPNWLPKPFTVAPPPDQPPARWASAAKYGAAADAPQAVTDGLRRALASGEAVVYLPHGTYLIDDALEIPATVRRIVGMNSTIRVAPGRKPSFSRTGGMLRIASAGESLSIENLAFDNTNQGAQLAIEVSGKRDVALRDIVSAGVVLLDRGRDGGRVHLENVCCGRMEIAGPEPVDALQFDTEGGGTRIVNRGSPLSILGLKTEGIATIVDNREGARTDIFGGLVYMVRDPQGAPPPAFQNSGSHLSAVFAEEVLKPGNQYRVYLARDGGAVEAKDFPERGPGRFVPALTAGPAAPPTQ